MTAEIRMAEPLSHQQPIIDSTARHKVVRAGRRFGKTRLAWWCAVMGHGAQPQGHGMIDGYDVAWVAPDYPQARLIWTEDIKPRCKGVEGVTLNETEHTVTIEDHGTLWIRSAEVIDGIRGIGKRLGGVIVDEAAKLDLEYAHRAVIRPALMDNQGWTLYMSTTNQGEDGGIDENGARRTPSYFNQLCEEIRDGKRGEEWEEFHGTAFDNARLLRSEIEALIAEYDSDDPRLDEEIYAKLLRGGVGLALPQMSKDVHIIPQRLVPAHWYRWAAFDWGYDHPYVFADLAMDEDGNAYLVDSLINRQQEPEEIAAAIRAYLGSDSDNGHRIRPKLMIAGLDLWHNQTRARGLQGPTLFEYFNSRGLTFIRADIDPVQGLSNLRRYTAWRETGKDRTPGVPKLRMFDTPNNLKVFACLAAMRLDPKKLEQAARLDAVDGRGGDDPFACLRYGMMARPITPKLAPQRNTETRGPLVDFSRKEVIRPDRPQAPTRAPRVTPAPYRGRVTNTNGMREG